jgi:FkbM family methyltransferase
MFKKALKFFYWFGFKQSNFSQSNEEEILNKIFSNTRKGFYVDVGCHHPKRFSNTAKLYRDGWNGINIDANPKNIKLFKFFRRRDYNIRALVSDLNTTLDYYYFNDSALNGCLTISRVESLKNDNYKVLKIEKISTKRLDQIISESGVNINQIDLLDIDVEGHDLQVLKSINLNLYDIRVILIETDDQENQIIEYLLHYNYHLYKRVDRNCFFLKK